MTFSIKNHHFTFEEQWTQFLAPHKYNWLTFVFAELDYEKYLGNRITFKIGLLGLTFTYEWYSEEFVKTLEDMTSELDELIELNKKAPPEGEASSSA